MKASQVLRALFLVTLGGSFSIAVAQQSASKPAGAQHSENILEEVIVSSARKRSENVQATPIAVTALDESLLEREHVADVTNLSGLAPNLHVSRLLTTADGVNFYMRGFGVHTNDPSNDPHLAVFIDGIYMPTVSGSLVDMFDIGQVEVLGGPQGTLFGKNAPIGAISMSTAKPTGEWGGTLQADVGRFDHNTIRAKLNFPVVPGILAGKVTFASKSGGNWITDLDTGKRDFGGEYIKSGRLSLAFTPNEFFRWDLVTSLATNHNPQNITRARFDVGTVDGDNRGTVAQTLQLPAAFGVPGLVTAATYCAFAYAGPCPVYPFGTTQPGFKDRPHGQTTSIASNMSYKFSPVTLTAIAGYYKYFLHENIDVDGTPIASLDAHDDLTHGDQKSLELRLSSNAKGGADLDGKLDWVLGAFYSKFDFDFNNNLQVFQLNAVPGLENGVSAFSQQYGHNKSSAAYAHGIYHFTDEWSGSAGVRYSKDEKTHKYTGGIPAYPLVTEGPVKFTNTSFEAGVQWQFRPDKMAFFRFAQGYQAGGFVGFPAAAGGGVSYRPTKNDAFDIGLKSDWLDKRLRVNLTYFHNKLKDLQVQSVIPIPVQPFFQQSITNAAGATVQGVELQLIAVPVESFTTRLTLGYLKPKYSEYNSTVCNSISLPPGALSNCTGVPFPFAPKVSGNLAADYTHYLANNAGKLTISGDVTFQTESFLGEPPTPSGKQGGYSLLNAAIGFTDPSEKYTFELYGTNLTNKEYLVDFTNPGNLSILDADGRPVEYGIRMTAKFGSH
jgi:iron complex outermembrane receptor protein